MMLMITLSLLPAPDCWKHPEEEGYLRRAKKIVEESIRHYLCDDPSKERGSLPLRGTNCPVSRYLVEMIPKEKLQQLQEKRH